MKKRNLTRSRSMRKRPLLRNNARKYDLRSQSELLKKTFNSSKDAIFLLDAANPPVVVECNRAASEIFGYTNSEMVGRPTNFLHTSDVSLRKFQAQLYPAIEKDEYFNLEYQMKRKDGSIFPSDHTVTSLLDDQEKRVGWISAIRDITERKRAEMALRDSEARYRILFDRANDALYVHDEEGRLLDVNTVACQRLGYSREELLKMSLKDIDGPDAAALIPQHIQEIRQQGHAVFESKNFRRDGSSFPVEVSARAITYKGEPAVLGIVRDITDRRKMEEAVRESEARYRKYYDLGLVGMVIETPTGGWIAANDRFCEMLGYSREELFKKHWTELTHPDDLAKDRDTLYPQLLRGEIENYSIEKRFVRKNGDPIDVIITVGCTRNADGKSDHVFGIVVDITERKNTEKALKESEAKYRALVEQSLQGIMIAQRAPPRVVFANPAMAKMLAYTTAELTSLSPKEIEALVHPEDRVNFFNRFDDRLQGKDTSPSYEFRAIRKNGEVRWMEVSSTMIEYQEQPAVQATFIDITERKRSEEALRASEERFRRITENMLDMVTQTDIQGICQYASPSFKTVLGYDPKSMMGRSLFELVHPEDLDSTLEIVLKALATKSTATFDYRCRHADGHYVWLQSVGNPLFDETGQISGTVLVTRDITERVEYETGLLALHKHASQLSSAKDLYTIVKHTLDAIESTLGFAHADFLLVENDALQVKGRRGIPVVFSAQPLNGRGLTVKAANTKTTLRVPDTRKEPAYVDPKGYDWTGPPSVISELIVPVVTDAEVVAVLCVDSTRTDNFNEDDQRLIETLAIHVGSELRRLRHEEELKRYSENLEQLVSERTKRLAESEDRFRGIAERSIDGIFETDLEGRLTYASPSAEPGLGYKPEDVIGTRLEQYFLESEIPKIVQTWAALMEGRNVLGLQGEMLRKDGTHMSAEMNASPIFRAGKVVGVQGIIRDISERKKLEAYLSDAQRLIAIGQTAAMVGHDLRNPLQAIATTMDLLRRQFESTPTEQKKLETKLSELEMINTIQDSVYYMDKIVSDLQAYAEPRILQLRQVDLNQLLKESISMAHIPSNIKVSVSITENHVLADPVIERVFVNLLLNAVQAMPNGGELTISTERHGKQILIHFQDTGVGIPKENLPKLFDPLYTTKAKGQGLGLAVCKRLVDAHEGSISVESTVDKGSTFTVKLPLER